MVDTIEAPNIGFVTEQLDRLNYLPLNISEKKNALGGLFAAKTKVDPKELIVFTKQFATLFKAGVPLVGCLQALEEQAGTPSLKEVIRKTADEIQSGKSLNEALSMNPKVPETLR